MKKIKKALALVLALAMIATVVPVASTEAASTAKLSATTATIAAGSKKVITLTTPSTWKKVKTSWKVGKKSVAQIVAVTKKASVRAQAAGETNVKVKVTYAKSNKKGAKRYGKSLYCKVTVTDNLVAKQTGAKKVTVTASKDLKDAKITVKKGNNTVNATSEVNGKTAILTLSANIVDEKYTVVVDDKETTFDGKASKISSIEIGDIAISDGTLPTTNAATTAKVAYRVLNQFEEDLAKTTSLTVTSSMTASAASGTVTLTLPQGTKEGDIATVVLIEGQTGVNASKTVKISAKASVSEVALGQIYNKDGKVLTEGTVSANTFYLLVDLKDQYGNTVTDPTTADTQTIITNAAGLTNVAFGPFTKVKVNNEDKLALPVLTGTIKPGNGTILVIAKNTGKNAQASYTVVDGVKVDSFSASPKDIVVGGSTAEFDFSAVDTYGKEITDPTEDKFNTVPAGFKFEKDATSGKTVLKYSAANVANDTPVIANFITATNKVVTVSFTVKKNAYPVAISKVKDFTAGVLNNNNKEVKIENVVFEDNYGREMKAADALKSINGTTYSLVVSAPDSYNNASATLNDTLNAGGSTTVTSSDKLVVTPTANSSNTFKLTLKAGSEIKDSKDITIVSKGIDDLTSYSVKDIALVNGNVTNNIATPLTVTGTADDGTVVDVPSSMYTVYGQLATNAGTAATISGKNLYKADEAVSEKEGSFDVVINNRKGTTISKKVKVSNKAAEVTTVELVNGNTLTVASTGNVTNAELLGFIKAKDQYGADINVGTPRITIKNVSDTLVASANGTTTTAISTASAKAYVELSYVFSNGVKFDTSATLSK